MDNIIIINMSCIKCKRFIPTEENPITPQDYLSRTDCVYCLLKSAWYFPSGLYELNVQERVKLAFSISPCKIEDIDKVKDIAGVFDALARGLFVSASDFVEDLSVTNSYAKTLLDLLKMLRNEEFIISGLLSGAIEEKNLPNDVYHYLKRNFGTKSSRSSLERESSERSNVNRE